MTSTPQAFRIVSPEGEAVELVRPELVELALELWNARRELDIDGNPIGVYTAVPAERGKGWSV